MPDYPIKRTPEEGHTKECYAKALIAAVENIRDSDVSDITFRILIQGHAPMYTADEYLETGSTQCYCQPIGVQEYLDV